MQPMKRKTPYSASPTPGGPPRFGGSSAVKQEDNQDVKRVKTEGPTKTLSASHGNFTHARTAAAAMAAHLKTAGTMGWQDAYFHVSSEHPQHNANEVLNILKKLERVDFNEVNQVFTYVPELTIANEAQLRTYIRTNSTSTRPVIVRDIREALPPTGLTMVEDLERRGDVLVMRSLTGPFKDAPLPKLGRANGLGLKINDGGSSGTMRLKTIWWDEIRERGRAGKRVDDEFVFAWDDIAIAETDDVVKLLEKENLGASSNMPAPPKISARETKKKPARRRALKITNSHMKEQGIDFSQDYVTES